jgi:hypothetical protein
VNVFERDGDLLGCIERFDRAVAAPRVREKARNIRERADFFFGKIDVFRRFERFFQQLGGFAGLLFFDLLPGDGLQSDGFNVRKFDFSGCFRGGFVLAVLRGINGNRGENIVGMIERVGNLESLFKFALAAFLQSDSLARLRLRADVFDGFDKLKSVFLVVDRRAFLRDDR